MTMEESRISADILLDPEGKERKTSSDNAEDLVEANGAVNVREYKVSQKYFAESNMIS